MRIKSCNNDDNHNGLKHELTTMNRSKQLFVCVCVFRFFLLFFSSAMHQRVIENPKPEQNIRLHEREPVKGQALKTATTTKDCWESHPSLQKTGRRGEGEGW